MDFYMAIPRAIVDKKEYGAHKTSEGLGMFIVVPEIKKK